MLRTLPVLLVLLVPLAASAAPTPEPAPPAERQVRDGGMIDGRLTGVDYQKSTLSIEGVNRVRLAVTVMPSTTIQGKDAGYHSILDLKPGEHVQIFSSVVGGAYVAQIIRILP